MVIAKAVNRAPPIRSRSTRRSKSYIAERISFKGRRRAGAGGRPEPVHALLEAGRADDDQHRHGTTTTDPVAAELAATRKSVNDLVRAELNSLMSKSALSSATTSSGSSSTSTASATSRSRWGNAGATCTQDGLSHDDARRLKSGLAFKTNGMIEDVVKLHLRARGAGVRLQLQPRRDAAVGRRHRRHASTACRPNASLGWPFHHLSHRVSRTPRPGTTRPPSRRTPRSTSCA